jgi:8-oxo-dGTP pyrophosphatase MutT (NUDIX family)
MTMVPGFDISTVRSRLRARPSDEPADVAKAAVAAILRDGERGAELLFIKRAEREGDPWSGHIAFPGGKREPGDPTLLDTAMRETREEVGIELPTEALLTRMRDIVGHTNGFRVAHYVFAPETAATTGNAEVASVMWVPLESIAAGEGAGTYRFVRGEASIDLPCLRWGDYTLWGMTYRMTMNLVEAMADV